MLSRRAALGALLAAGASPLVVASCANQAPTTGPVMPRPSTPEDALHRLQDGNQRFVAGTPLHPNQTLELRQQLAGHQQPFASVLGCADSRTAPELAVDAGIGDLFVCRVAGNIATPADTASLLYAQAVLGTEVLLVLGHDNCGAVKTAIEVAEGKTPPGEFAPLVAPIQPAVAQARQAGATGDALLHEAVVANVRHVVAALPEMSAGLAQAVRAGHLTIHGGVLTLSTGKIDPVT
ncbi:carbonic anhydrase [Saccharopolyspora sp. NPDC002686]|uniref:carbonic anhydrase n=1 Tax=Saccharopolyspora sp. NPDC002686 TaxID=3154541 RepID=UPI003333984C